MHPAGDVPGRSAFPPDGGLVNGICAGEDSTGNGVHAQENHPYNRIFLKNKRFNGEKFLQFSGFPLGPKMGVVI